jgi:4-oxalocrotonate tautomerase
MFFPFDWFAPPHWTAGKFRFKEVPPMPYVNVRITRDGATAEQKAELIKGVTDLLVRVLDKDPARTFVVIDEVDTDNWGVGGISVSEIRRSTT